MKISIITIAYNSSATIKDTIESVLSQTYQDLEYVIVDGYSRDDTVDIIRKYEPRFDGRMRWISESDNGLYDAMNKGILMATGEVVGLINSDDLFVDSHAVEKVMRLFELNNNLDSVYADLYYVSHNDTSKIIRHWTTGKQKPFKYGWHPAHPTLYLKKKLYKKYGLFNLNFKLAADFEIMLRFLEKYKVSTCYLEETLVKMRLGGVTNKSLRNIFKQNLECIKAFRLNGLNVNVILYIILRTLFKLSQFRK